jgi:hypothetical protein
MYKYLALLTLITLLSIENIVAEDTYNIKTFKLFGESGKISPVIGDIDGNIDNGKEIVVATTNGIVSAYSSTGSLLWTTELPVYNCMNGSNSNKLHSSPAIGDLNNDGTPNVVIGYGGIGITGCNGGILALSGLYGQIEWIFDTGKDTPKETLNSVFSTPALADIDNNGQLEIGFGSHNRHVYLLSSTGKILFKYHTADTVFSSASFLDVDRDGTLELIMGSDISKNEFLKTPNGGYLYAFKLMSNKRSLRRNRSKRSFSELDNYFGFLDKKAFVWKQEFDQVIQGSPVIAELFSNSVGEEIVTSSGCYFPENSDDKSGKWLKVLSSRRGKVLATLETSACMAATPAVADLNGDGLNDIVALVSGAKSRGGNGNTVVIAWSPATNSVLWQTTPYHYGVTDSLLGDHGKQPVIADLNGDGINEIIVGMRRGAVILDSVSGEQLTCSDRECEENLTINLSGTVNNTPAVADLDNNGTNELVISAGELFIGSNFNFFSINTDKDIPKQPYQIPWGMWRRNSNRNGVK